MKILADFTSGIFLVDFEFHPLGGVEGNPPVPVCMVVHELGTNKTARFSQDELEGFTQAPFPTDENALFVAYFATAELNCFRSLGWPLPKSILDLYVEFRVHTNGIPLEHGKGLLGAMLHYGIAGGIDSEQKDGMRDLILSMGPWTTEQKQSILDYCETDVIALKKLITHMSDVIDFPRALLRGEYMTSVSAIETAGVPLDHVLLIKLQTNWENIKDRLIETVDTKYGVYENGVFKANRFEKYLNSTGIPWLRLPTGKLDMSDDAFREMARIYPQISPLRELRYALSKMRLSTLTVGDDGRNRCMISPFSSTTGRNQPSNTRFIYGPSVWMRGLIRPAEGYAIAYIDWSQQEFGIAAALSGDPKMKDAYASGDPYLAFARQAGAVPADATKRSHKAEREQFKACVLAVQYGMGPDSLALRINQPVARARQLLDLHRITYRTFWDWSDISFNEFSLSGKLWTNYGWQIKAGNIVNERSVRNFPMQAHGAEMLRIACILLNREGINICAPVHDAILIEAPIFELDSVVSRAQELMAEASRIVLYGFELASDAKVVRSPDRFMDERGIVMWNTVMKLMGEPEYENV